MEKEISILKHKLLIEDELGFEKGKQIRGFFAHNFGEEVLFHNHKKNGKLLHKYPKIQYKIEEGQPFIVSIGEGKRATSKAVENLEMIKIGNRIYKINQVIPKEEKVNLNVEKTNKLNHLYFFDSPWLAFNPTNYKEIRFAMGGKKATKEVRKKINSNKEFVLRFKDNNREEQEKIIERILKNQIISVAKGLDWTINNQIRISLNFFKYEFRRYKGFLPLAVNASFKTNVLLPNDIGIGNGTSIGYGKIKRIK